LNYELGELIKFAGNHSKQNNVIQKFI
jgi:hypothetical protein